MITGRERVVRALAAVSLELPKMYGDRVVADVNHAGAVAAARIIKSETPRGATGNLKSAVRAVRRKGRGTSSSKRISNNYSVVGFVYPLGAHAHLLESGTAVRVHQGGREVGSVRATGFFSRAFEAAKPLIFQAQVRSVSTAFKRQQKNISRHFGR